MRPPQLGDKACAQLGDGRARIGNPLGEQLGWRAVAQEIKCAVPENQGRSAGKEHRLLHGRLRAVGEEELMCEGQLGCAIAQAG